MSTWRRSQLCTANPIFLVAVASLTVLTILSCILLKDSFLNLGNRNRESEILVYCAAGMRIPVEEVAKEYEQKYGIPIRLQYGGSNSLLSQIEVGKVGDLYLAADESYIRIAQEKGLMAEECDIATMRPVIVVPPSNQKRIEGLDDLTRKDVRVALANPDQAAIGKITRKRLSDLGKWDELESQVQKSGVFKPTVNDVINDVLLGSVDAGIVWDAVAAQFTDIGVIRSPELDQEGVLVCIGILNSCNNPSGALHFSRYLSARDRGLKSFESHGYDPVEGDLWSEDPQLTLFAGSVNRLALEPIVNAFERRHGVTVHTVYNGCGILTAQMQILKGDSPAGFPDAYMACDQYYMDTVGELFQDKISVSDTQIVIAVRKGNPKQITSLRDLNRFGVRVAIGQPEQCTIGVLSRRLLKSAGIYDSVMQDNVVTQTATSSLLIPSIVTGAADAALVYNTDAKVLNGEVDTIVLDSQLAQAIQPLGIAKSSEKKQLAEYLYRAIAQGRQDFEAVGFRWRLGEEVN